MRRYGYETLTKAALRHQIARKRALDTATKR